ncbi:MAG: glycosyltransferase family 4 protein [Pirellulales bacterium]|nr:glycosyltransferase family 4 protein [Pirellulales bacterium]
MPPPVTGLSVLTEKVVDSLKERTSLLIGNFSAGDSRPSFRTRIIRTFRATACLAKLLLHGRKRNGRLYLACNSQGGLLMTALTIKLAHLLGYKVFLHHHGYMYIDEYDWRMKWTERYLSPNDVHLMHAQQMIDDYRNRYTSKAQFTFMYPAIAAFALGNARQNPPLPLRLGFLANLTLAKGIDLVLDTFEKLHERGRNVQLVLAGMIASDDAERLVNEALRKYDGAVRYVGAVYNEQKHEYFKSIDCFLFPSRTEAWPIVLNEAQAEGLPIVATNRGCIRTCVDTEAGLVVYNPNEYVDLAVRQVEEWMDSPEKYAAASRAAIAQAERFQREGKQQLEQLVSRICSP